MAPLAGFPPALGSGTSVASFALASSNYSTSSAFLLRFSLIYFSTSFTAQILGFALKLELTFFKLGVSGALRCFNEECMFG